MRIDRVSFLLPVAISIACLLSASFALAASTPVFTITPTTPQPQQIPAGTTATANFNVKNTSPTTLTGSGVVNLPQGVTQVVGAGLCGTTFTLTPGQSCNLQLSINSDELANGQAIGGPEVCNTPSNQVYCSKPCDGDELHVTLTTGPTPPVGDVLVTPNTDPANQHLGYRAINVQNNTSGAVSIDSVTFSGVNASQEHYCTAGGDTSCFFQTTCTNPIPASGSCLIWIKALQSGALGSTSGTIDVTIAGTSHVLNTTYLLQLVAGADDIYTWDNTAWSNLLGAGTPGGSITSLVLDQAGDLLFAGLFSFVNSGNTIANIGRYNGSAIIPLAGGTSGRIYRAAVDAANNVYAGGIFLQAQTTGGGGVANTQCLAKWDAASSQWVSIAVDGVAGCSGSSFGNLVSDIVIDPATSNAYIVGRFDQIGVFAGLDNVAQWNGATLSTLPPGLRTPVDTGYVADFFQNNFFVGGLGISIVNGGVPATSLVAQWSVLASSWPNPNMQGGLAGPVGVVFDLAHDATRVYAGGSFDHINSGSGTANIAGWDPVVGNWRAFSGIPVYPADINDPEVDAIAIDPVGNLYAAFFDTAPTAVMYQGSLSGSGTVAMSLMPQQIGDTTTPRVTSLVIMPSFTITP